MPDTPAPHSRKVRHQASFRVCLVKNPSEVRTELSEALAPATWHTTRGVNSTSPWFSPVASDLSRQFARLTKALAPPNALGQLAKKSSGVATDLNENVVRELAWLRAWST